MSIGIGSMKKRGALFLTLVSASVSLAAYSAQINAAERNFADGSIASTAEYHGDYFLKPNGETVKLYRKKGVFILPAARTSLRSSKLTSSSSSATFDRLQTTFQGQLSRLTKHNLPGMNVVKIEQRSKALAHKATGGVSKTISADVIERSLKGAIDVQPVFTTKSGRGDLMLLPKLTIELNDSADPNQALADLQEQYKLQVLRQLKVSGNVYSLQIQGANSDPSKQFALARSLANEGAVKWAEPQFFMQAERSAFTPNDTLFGQQWSLNNAGYRGSRCDADCDVDNAWDLGGGAISTRASTGFESVIAIIDDGVQLNHPDLEANISMNLAELNGTPSIDDDANGYIDDVKGYDFVDDSGTFCGDDGIAGVDSDPSPSPVVGCTISGDAIDADNHGTAVAGIAAAVGSNSIGIAGVAFNASIFPVRAISEYEVASPGSTALCDRLAEAMEFSAQNADVINASWNLPIECAALNAAIERTTNGTVTVGSGSKRDGTGGNGAGSPVVVSSGNNASGWVKVTVPVLAGEHAYEWRYLRSEFPDAPNGLFDDTVWLDDIRWSDGSTESFETTANFSSGDFSSEWVLNSCNAQCTFGGTDEPVWGINTNPVINYARTGSNAASLFNPIGSECGNSYLHTLRDGPAGEMSFWVWVSANTQDGFDKFEFLIDGEEVLSYGDLAAFGFVDNTVGYPANLSNAAGSMEQGVIAVGASTSGSLSGNSSVSDDAQYRAPYSQFGPTLDVVAPGGDQHLGITTTDREAISGADNLGFNTSASASELADRAYTQNFMGTSAAAPVVSGIAAAIIATDPTLSAQEVKDLIKDNADQIDTNRATYSAGRNDQYGHGRANMFKALRAARGETVSEPAANCAADSFDYMVANDRILPRFAPQTLAGFCPALGPLASQQEDESALCFPVPTSNGGAAVICL